LRDIEIKDTDNFPSGKISRDCRFYRGDRPCVYHKKEGVKCEECRYYSPFSDKILIIKLDALGDVLRTTSLLPALRERYPQSLITWITLPGALDLFVNNPYVDRVVPLDPDGLIVLLSEEFSLAINLDTAPRAAGLLAAASASVKKGFTLDERGWVKAADPEAERWLRMSVFDDVKKANRETYQAIAARIAGLRSAGEIVLRLGEKEEDYARRFARENGLPRGGLRIGLNTGGGGRWEFKKWTREATLELARRCAGELDARVLLYGGTAEEERNGCLKSRAGDLLVDTGCRNSLRRFFSLLSLCDILVTSDTMALHAALGLGKKVVALFGPTSPWEIELYGRGRRVIAPVDCQCCYLPTCRVRPNCMETISPEMVFEAIRELL